MDFILRVAIAIGLLSLSKLLLGALKFIWITFLRPPKNLVKTYGSWALVTGAANGIGRATAFQLASKGLNLVLLDRDEVQLENTAKKIQEEFGCRVEVRCILMDLNKLKKDEIINTIQEEIDGLDVGVLINNAGVAYDFTRYLHEVEPDMVESTINVNAGAVTWTTMAVLPSMIKKHRGAIVNIGSGSANVVESYPFVAIYGATKAYVKHFSKSISLEYKSFGIDVQCQMHLFVATTLIPITMKGNLFVPSPETLSKASVRWIGYETTCVPYWPHYLQGIVCQTLPDWFVNWCMVRFHLYIRDRFMKEEAASAAVRHGNKENGKKES